MDQHLDSLEEKLKKSKKTDKKEHKVAGRSVFKLQEIIKEKGALSEEQDSAKDNLKH